MSLFRVNPDQPFQGPHQNQPVTTAGISVEKAAIGMILVHGRGASAESMLLFEDEFDRTDIHYRALQAAGYTWYPRSFLAPTAQNQRGINSGLQAIYDQINMLNEAGIASDHIVLLGFSQGACLTCEFAARHPRRYGGVVAFSGGLIGARINPEDYSGSLKETPVFMGCSDRDPHIPQERLTVTESVLKSLGAAITKKIYPAMGHTVNRDEITHANNMLKNI